MVGILTLTMLFMTTFGAILGLIGKPGTDLPLKSKRVIGEFVSTIETGKKIEYSVDAEILSRKTIENTEPVFSIFVKIIPENIFSALTNMDIFKILFFSIILGIAVSLLPSSYSILLLNMCSGLFQAFQKITQWAMYILPFGICCIFANHVAAEGHHVILALLKLISIFCVSALILTFIDFLVISYSTKTPLVKTIKYLQQPLWLSFGSSNPFIALPATLQVLDNRFTLDKKLVNLLLPIGITSFPFSFIFEFSFFTIFLAQINHIEITFTSIIIVCVGALLSAMASGSSPALIAFSTLSTTFAFLGIPFKSSLIILIGINMVIAPFAVVLTLFTNCAFTAFIARKNKE